MRKLLLLLVLFISVEGSAQPGDTVSSNIDSTLIKLQKFEDSMLTTIPRIDSNEIKENFDRNISGILEMQKNRRVKEKRAAMIRIAIGVAFLIVLIIGLRRKTVKK
jgi:hypothetical protein